MSNRFRYFIEIAYNGSAYHGWQMQKNAVSVQGCIQQALSTLFQSPISIMGSGRTDTGVHAYQQFAHFDLDFEISKMDFLKRINGLLPDDIAIFDLRPVQENAHARFDAQWRSYSYHISFRKDPFLLGKAWHCYYDLEVTSMQEATKVLLEYKDFQCFSKIKTNVKTFDCKINNASWEQTDHGLVFHIQANRFLRGMVRAIVGTLVKIGRNHLDGTSLSGIIESKDRKQAGVAAPACGLYLNEVRYPERIFK
ncbi:tRNA pseudouridine(38-40) synthase TruA [Cyclobacterium jeungdonense]|uniref:tRNA pseudouridine synthase A n=1 Tax=Cyclobacterium jeungdonense TaxID=708087 RepID=A0ABT8C1M6_9BACT|nr:tRNA pseudouridine(38-40) synthase TruA [Cyclobacterium jeungdonense]MDN3686636.1 tRNA pseudouridine(38-40) synthase TruA [Cyclobacterium jeungdonense]